MSDIGQAADYRAGYVAIIGRPNVGKSTLLNHLVGQKISITSRRPQTTRQRVTGIVTRDTAQLIFVDTPGFQTGDRTALSRFMNRTVTQALQGIDVLLWVIEAGRYTAADEALRRLLPPAAQVVLVINKIDRLADRSQLLPLMQEMSARHEFSAIVPVSATGSINLDRLLDVLSGLLPAGQPIHDADEVTTASERFLAAELVREKLFRLLGEELPYAAAVEVERFETEGNLRRIHVGILVDKASQKGIVIGHGGEKLKKIASQARQDMERLFGGKVFLEVWVRVKSGWADNAAELRRMGYE